MTENNPPVPPVQPPTPPTPPGDEGKKTDFDPSKLSDEQLSKVLEDERIWKTKRLAELREKSKKADEYEANKSKEEEQRLEKEKKHEELANMRAKERDDWKGKFTRSQADNAIMAEASKLGIKDLDAAIKLIDRSKISVDDNGAVSGVVEAVAALAAEKPYLTSETVKKPIGSGSNPPGSNQDYDFTMSQIGDPIFYRANEAAIKVALSKNRVKEDRF